MSGSIHQWVRTWDAQEQVQMLLLIARNFIDLFRIADTVDTLKRKKNKG